MEFTLTEERILALAMARGSTTIKTICSEIELDESNAAQVVNLLRTRKLLVAPGTRRDGCRVLFLTPAGKEAVRAGSGVVT